MDAESRARAVRLLVLDVDGVLTDGGLYYDHAGQVSKRFDVQDGLGIRLAQQAGIEVAVITGLDSEAVSSRIRRLGIIHYHAGIKNKFPVLQAICAKTGISLEQTAYIGDDWVDAEPMSRVGFPVAVANARPHILSLACLRTGRSGGRGAVREGIEYILAAQGSLERLWASFLETGERVSCPG